MDQKTVDKLSKLIFYNKKMMEYYGLFLAYEVENIGKKVSCGDIGSKMKEIIDKEDTIYDSLNVNELNEMFHFVFTDISSAYGRQRIVGHLSDKLQRILLANITFLHEEYSVDEEHYLSMLDSIVDIDSLNRINNMIKTTDGIDNNSYIELLKNWILSKFVRLSRNSYIERIAIDNDFDINKIKLMTFDKIKESLSDDAIAIIEHKYITAMEGELQALSTLDKTTDVDPLIRTYTAMTALVNIEVRLEFLRIEAFGEFKDSFMDKYGNNKAEQMRYAKKLILKKEEEFN